MQVYITYDAHHARTELKAELLKNGFSDRWSTDNKTYYLPNTSLWHPNLLNVATAKQKFITIVNSINSKRLSNDKVVIDRFIVVPAEPFDGIEGLRHSS